jgi:hypothetical protein
MINNLLQLEKEFKESVNIIKPLHDEINSIDKKIGTHI